MSAFSYTQFPIDFIPLNPFSVSHLFPTDTPNTRSRISPRGVGLHLVELGAGRGDLLDAELTELSLELTELLGELVLVLAPKLGSLNLARRLFHKHCQHPVTQDLYNNR